MWDREQRALVFETSALTHGHEGMEHSMQQASLLTLSDVQSVLGGSPAFRRKNGAIDEKSGPFSFRLQDKDIKKLETKIDRYVCIPLFIFCFKVLT
jgi:hypothetical protein